MSASNGRPQVKRQSSIVGFMRKLVPKPVAEKADQTLKTVHDSFNPVPVAMTPPDGLTNEEAKAASDAAPPVGLLDTLKAQLAGGTLKQGAATFVQAGLSAAGPLDDRELLLENLVDLLAGLPANSSLGTSTTNEFVSILWNDLPHPPQSFVGPSQFRSADGSGNSFSQPSLGAAGQPYARSVPAVHPKLSCPPDAGVVFDALLRREGFRPHPSGISSLLFAFATLIIHTIFETGRAPEQHINQASSYLDLSVLYGNNQEQQDAVRTKEQGMLHQDTVASGRLYLMPPQTIALLLVFARNHNSIAADLFAINEAGKYKPVGKLSEAEAKAQDEDLFQRAKLINCGWFMNIIFQDYIKAILNLVETDSLWSLIPLGDIRKFPSGMVERGGGNAVSVEFNMLYRWHSAISEHDEKWIEEIFKSVLGDDKAVDDYTARDFGTVLAAISEKGGTDPRKWEIPGHPREADGSYADETLVGLLSDSTERVAGAFGARGVPAVMRVVEEMGIQASRSEWAVGTMNEFRRFLHLKEFGSFEEWAGKGNEVVAQAARKLYTHIDNLELHPGLVAEEAKPSIPGSGLAPGYTVSRAILSDAVALTRGDRHFTRDWNSAALTSWGFESVQPNTQGGSYGGMLGPLLMNTFPEYYVFNSAYALYPFVIPSRARAILQDKLKVGAQYDFARPARKPRKVVVDSHQACVAILGDDAHFERMYGPSKAVIEQLAAGEPFFALYADGGAAEAAPAVVARKAVADALQPAGWQAKLDAAYTATAQRLTRSAQWSYDGGKTFNLDVVRDVVQPVGVEWAAEALGIPLKSDATPHGLISSRNMYNLLVDLYSFLFVDLPVSEGFKARTRAVKAVKILKGLLLAILSANAGKLSLQNVSRGLLEALSLPTLDGLHVTSSSRALYVQLLATKQPLEGLASALLAVLVETVVPAADRAANVAGWVLASPQKAELAGMLDRAHKGAADATASQELLLFVRESLRVNPPQPFVRRTCTAPIAVAGAHRSFAFAAGEEALLDLVAAGVDPGANTNPHKVDIRREPPSAPLLDHELSLEVAEALNEVSVVAVVRGVLRLPEVGVARGKQGRLGSVGLDKRRAAGYVTAQGGVGAFPQGLGIVFGVKTNGA